MPDVPPPVFVSGFGEKAIKLAGRIADGYMCVQPNANFVRLYRESGGGKRTMQGGLKVFWGPDEAGARKTMHRLWSNEAIPGEAAQLLPLPRSPPYLWVPGQCSAASPRAASSARPATSQVT